MKNYVKFLFFLFLSQKIMINASSESEERDYYPEEIPLLEEKNMKDPKENEMNPDADEDDLEEQNNSNLMKQFKKISRNLSKYEIEAKNCIKEIEPVNFAQETLDECTGENFLKLILGIKYEMMRVFSKSENTIRDKMLKLCYEPAGSNDAFLESCDHLERDALELMWEALDFAAIIDYNKKKYISGVGKMPALDYKSIYDALFEYGENFFELLEEIDAHKDIILIGLKIFIDEQKNDILEQSKDNPKLAGPKNLLHSIEIEQTEVKKSEEEEDRKLLRNPSNFIKILRFNKK